MQLRDTVNAREMQPDGTYVKVRPPRVSPRWTVRWRCSAIFQNGFVQETDKPEKPKAESKPKAAAIKAAVKPVTSAACGTAPNVQVCCKACSDAEKNKEKPEPMKSCVVTANYACDPNKVWLYLTKPTLNGWRRDVSSYEESDDGLKAAGKRTPTAARLRSSLPARKSPGA